MRLRPFIGSPGPPAADSLVPEWKRLVSLFEPVAFRVGLHRIIDVPIFADPKSVLEFDVGPQVLELFSSSRSVDDRISSRTQDMAAVARGLTGLGVTVSAPLIQRSGSISRIDIDGTFFTAGEEHPQVDDRQISICVRYLIGPAITATFPNDFVDARSHLEREPVAVVVTSRLDQHVLVIEVGASLSEMAASCRSRVIDLTDSGGRNIEQLGLSEVASALTQGFDSRAT